MPEKTTHDLLVGLHVSDNAVYSEYRAAMSPLLHQVGGSFRYDFTVSEDLLRATEPRINRLFVISFPDSETKDSFFAHPDYLAAKSKFFERSVELVKILAEFDSTEQ